MPRRYKPMRNVSRARPFKPMQSTGPTEAQQRSAEFRAKYPSHVTTNNPSPSPSPKVITSYNNPDEQRSAQFTVAIAYNKGAYQVIPADDIQHIGK